MKLSVPIHPLPCHRLLAFDNLRIAKALSILKYDKAVILTFLRLEFMFGAIVSERARHCFPEVKWSQLKGVGEWLEERSMW